MIVAVVAATACIACQSSDAPPTHTDVVSPAATPIDKIQAAADTILAGENDTLIHLTNGKAIVRGHIEAKGKRPTYRIDAVKGTTVIAMVQPVDKPGNIRINQIQKPNGSMDGPFGDSVHYKMPVTGQLKILLGENQMAGDPWSGDFILNVSVE